MNDEQHWMQRLDAYCLHLEQVENVQSGAHRSIVRRWIELSLEHERDPSVWDESLFTRMVGQNPQWKEVTRSTHKSDLLRWCRWASDSVDTHSGNVLQLWFKELEGYIAWRARVGGREGKGIAPDTERAIRSNVRAWIRHAFEAGLEPAEPDTDALQAFLANKNITNKSRRWREGHIRRWWRRWPQYQESLGVQIVNPSPTRDRLAELVAEFRADGYPSDEDLEHQEIRQQHERTLTSLADISYENRDSLKRVWANTKRNYGSSGNQQVLNKAIKDAAASDWPDIREHLTALCLGDAEIADRIDEAVDRVYGLGPLVATRLPAICHPEKFIPIYVLRSSSQYPGKLDMIELLDQLGLLGGMEELEAEAILRLHKVDGGTGEVVVRSNDLLLEALRAYFTDEDVVDTWGISRFLYWLAEDYFDNEMADSWIDDVGLAGLADELLCGVDFLKDIVALLEDKRQVILYGPSGTGKTHFAQEVAWALAHYDDEAYSLVQFHPAYSYEDFFEGFRPQVDGNEQMTYELMPGPLVQLAERAEEHPEELHVMVIDEINRANLPRVLGELLYLLEYRDESIQTQYRPDGDFSLPKNLWFIGTMNTADRSIALIDGAMRRRFHFVPFFPNHGPTAGLLRRWMQRNSPAQEWVAGLVDKVNKDLAEQMGGDHSLIGPSHFMTSDLDKDGLRRIWEYNIEPLIEDQLFGRQEVIESFRFGSVWRRHGPGATSSGAQPAEPDDQSVGPADEAGSLTGESEGVAEEGDA